MAKKKRVPLNRLVTSETFELVKLLAVDLECSEGEVLDQAVILLNGSLDSMVSQPAEVAALPSIPTGEQDVAGLRGMITEMQGKSTVLGVVEEKYVKADGRPMNFFEKKEVDRREAVAAKAATDKAAVLTGRDDVDYEAFND